MTTFEQSILKVKVKGAIQDVITKSTIELVAYDDTTTLADKLAEILVDIGTRAKSSEVSSQIQTAVDTAINGLINGAPEAYNTLKEIADYITAHEDVKDALEQSIGNKLDKTTFDTFCNSVSKLGALAGKDTVSEEDLAPALKEKVNAASEGNHSHNNKEILDDIDSDDVDAWDNAASKAHEHEHGDVLDEIDEAKVTAWDEAAEKKHEHSNKEALDAITAEKVAEWSGAAHIYVQSEQPADMKEGDIWIQTPSEE